MNGIAITSSTNQVDGAIQGVTLNLQQEGSSTLTVARDDEAIREAVTGFVESYNALKETADDLTAFNGEDSRAGTLIGDNVVRTIESRLRNDLSSGVQQDGELSLLGDVGLSMGVDGTLELDQDALDDALAADPAAVEAFFAGDDATSGLAGTISETAEQMTSDSGTLNNAIDGAENRIDSLNDRYTRIEASIEQTVERYRTQFSQLDSMVARMNSTSNYLSQQLSSLNSGNGGLL
ncbi:flagellar hook-associated protein 2 [Halomonas elongata]|uniref:Flagellar hook-associated protein 2 n=1 Tax=Halomonas elongata TaxID=2746 RepID=A0A1B8NZG6_HALEL|nr:flagellar filament capping protein FliD [Halomonas elongata]OBX35411.1 flagellar hook-associated protein 2 [Halomonas elongata]